MSFTFLNSQNRKSQVDSNWKKKTFWK